MEKLSEIDVGIFNGEVLLGLTDHQVTIFIALIVISVLHIRFRTDANLSFISGSLRPGPLQHHPSLG